MELYFENERIIWIRDTHTTSNHGPDPDFGVFVGSGSVLRKRSDSNPDPEYKRDRIRIRSDYLNVKSP